MKRETVRLQFMVTDMETVDTDMNMQTADLSMV